MGPIVDPQLSDIHPVDKRGNQSEESIEDQGPTTSTPKDMMPQMSAKAMREIKQLTDFNPPGLRQVQMGDLPQKRLRKEKIYE